MKIDHDGWCSSAIRLISPNQNERPENQVIDLLVVHNISLPPGEFGGAYIADLFLNQLDYQVHPFFEGLRSLRVSSHFLIMRDGTLFQFVSANKRAWHAGVSSYCGRVGCNDFSIGVEVEGTDYEPFMPVQYTTLVSLSAALCLRYPIEAVAGHQDVAPERKTDPGPFFNWAEFRRLLQEKGVRTLKNDPLKFPFQNCF